MANQLNAEMDAGQHLRDVSAAIEAEAAKAAAPAPKAGGDAAFSSEASSSSPVGGSALGLDMGLGEAAGFATSIFFGPQVGFPVGVAAIAAVEATSGNSFFMTNSRQQQNRVLDGGKSPVQPNYLGPVSLLPASALTYGEKSAAAKAVRKTKKYGAYAGAKPAANKGASVFERGQIAGLSLNGGSLVPGTSPVPPKGVTITPAMIRGLGGVSADMIRDLDDTIQVTRGEGEVADRHEEEKIRRGQQDALRREEERAAKQPHRRLRLRNRHRLPKVEASPTAVIEMQRAPGTKTSI